MAMSLSNLRLQVPVPTPPAPPAPPTFSVVQGGGGVIELPGRVLTSRDLQTLRARRSELSNQLNSATGRRDELSAAIRKAEGVDRAGLEKRLELLDTRILQLESDIAANGRLLASAPASFAGNFSTTQPTMPLGLNPGQVTGIAIVGTIFVLFPLAIALARTIWKRGSRPAPSPVSTETAQRMERLEQAVDAIAIEVERISEGQRFVTRLLTEGSAPALAVGQRQAEPVRLPDRDAARVSRERA
jgi:hypothetical protein